MENNIESGFFLEKIPYIKHWTKESKKTLVIFPGTENLIQWPTKDLLAHAESNRLFVPDEYTMYVLGYDKNLPMDHTTDQIADEFAQILKEHIGPATIMAFSYGGSIAIPFAARYHDLTEKLLLVTAAHTGSDEGTRFASELIHLAEKGESYPVLKKVMGLFSNIFRRMIARIFIWKQRKIVNPDEYPISTFIHAYKHLLATMPDRKKYLSKIKAPTLVIGANKDKLFSEKNYRETADLIPDGKVTIFNSGHMVMAEKTNQVRKAIVDFLLP